MHSVSSLYNRLVAEEDHKFDARVEIAGVDYVYNGNLRSLITRAHTFGSDTIQLGKADSREIELEIFGNSSRIPRNAQMNVYVRAMNAEETDTSEWIPKGVFFIDVRSKDSEEIDGDEVISITGMDAMMRGEHMFSTFPDSWLERGKTTAIEAMEYAAQQIGVTIDSRTYNLMSRNFDILLPTQYTIRETLRYIAALYGGSFIINDYGYLQLICPWSTGANCDLGVNAQGLRVFPPYSSCTGIRMLIASDGYTTRRKKINDDGTEGEEEVDCYFAGDESGYVFNIDCPWATQEQANWLYYRMAGYVYVPYQGTTGEIDPKYEIGDTVTVSNPRGGSVSGGIYSQEFTFGKYLTCDFGAPGEEEIDHEYAYESSTDRQYTRRLYNAEATLVIHQDEIMARVTKTGGDEDSTFGWVLESDHWDVFSGSPDNVVLHVDKDGLTVKGDGEFSGYLTSAEIYIPTYDDWNFKVDRAGNMYANSAEVTGLIRANGGIYVGDEIVATRADLEEIRQLTGGQYGSGNAMLNSLRAANSYNKAILEGSEYPDYFRAKTIVGVDSISCSGTINGRIRATSIIAAPIDSGGEDVELTTHSHTIGFDEDDGKIELTIGGPSNDLRNKASFNIADTKKYKDMVSALTVKSITFTESAKETYYEIVATAKNAAGEELLHKTHSTDSTVYSNGRNSVTVSCTLSEGTLVTQYDQWRRMYVPKYIPVTGTATGSNGKTGSDTINVWVENIWSDAYYDGYAAGEAAHANDYSNGYDSGYDNGWSNGYNDGWYYGYEQGYADGSGVIY